MKAGRCVTRLAVAFEAGRDGFWLAQSASGFGTFTQTGGVLVLQATPAGVIGKLTAGTINLGGTLQIAPQGAVTAFVATQRFTDVITATTSLNGQFATITTSTPLFAASVTPDAATANALDVTLRFNTEALAQVATQNLRLGLQVPDVLTQTVQNRLVVGSSYDGGGVASASLSGPAPQITGGAGVLSGAGAPGGASPRGGVWARGYGVVGNASASGIAPSFQENRVGLIAGADWRVTDSLVLGVAGTYANFAEGSNTHVDSYEGAAYAGWNEGPWYATGIAGAGVNQYNTNRQLAPFGLPGTATSNPNGTSYSGYGEAGYALPQQGWTLTPYGGLGYTTPKSMASAKPAASAPSPSAPAARIPSRRAWACAPPPRSASAITARSPPRSASAGPTNSSTPPRP